MPRALRESGTACCPYQIGPIRAVQCERFDQKGDGVGSWSSSGPTLQRTYCFDADRGALGQSLLAPSRGKSILAQERAERWRRGILHGSLAEGRRCKLGHIPVMMPLCRISWHQL